MKIAHVATTSIPVVHDKGGAVQRRILGVAREQSNRGHDVIVYSPGQEGPVDVEGVRVVSVPLRSRRPYRDYEYLLKVRAMASKDRPDVIHSHGLPDAGRVLGPCAVMALTVDYFRYRLSSLAIGRGYYRTALMSYDWVFPVSDFCAAGLRDYYQLGDAPIEVVYNGVDLNQFFPDSTEAKRIREKYSFGSQYLLYLGRINQQKGSDMLPILAAAVPELLVVAAGPLGQFGTAAPGRAINPLASTGVRYIGVVPEADLRGLLNGATALVLPTRQDEMFGMVLVEAGACGTPSIASDVGGIPEAMGSGGVLFEAGSTNSLIEVVRSLVNDHGQVQALGLEALENAKKFAWHEIADKYLQYYSRPRGVESRRGGSGGC